MVKIRSLRKFKPGRYLTISCHPLSRQEKEREQRPESCKWFAYNNVSPPAEGKHITSPGDGAVEGNK
ncbi:hypothetical protein E2C01_020555 [Portunus trituberculatus]|uniref:Uncharacterized protein n=1 Tax=Portunus trituberculatus TaxID=210409 RepID=A0A5B7E1T7_PORTR|nr:hypothetical protein [Portunus trituberculatus]